MEVKGEVPVHAMKTYRGSRGIAPLILNLGTSCKVNGEHHAPAALPSGRNPDTR